MWHLKAWRVLCTTCAHSPLPQSKSKGKQTAKKMLEANENHEKYPESGTKPRKLGKLKKYARECTIPTTCLAEIKTMHE